MSDITPVQVVLATFNEDSEAGAALKKLEDVRRQARLDFDDAAVIRKDAQGKLHIKETGDTSAGKGATIGAVIGGVIGLLAGPIGVLAGAGAIAGGLAAKGDAGLKDEPLAALGKSLEPGNSAVVLVVPQVWVEAVQKQLEATAGEIMTELLPDDIARKLTANEDIGDAAGTET
jgi:uncharacterized membrane protein